MFAVIVNPVSGGGEAVRLAIRISERIAAMGQESRLFETSGDGDAARQTRAAVEAGCEAVVCIGGDGTICEAAGSFATGMRRFTSCRAARATTLPARSICPKTRWRRLKASLRASRFKSTAAG